MSGSDDYRDFIAPASEDEGKSGSDQDIEAYRNQLLSGLNGKPKKRDEEIDLENLNSDDLDSDGEIKATPDIQFTTGFGEDIGKKLQDSKKAKSHEKSMTPFEKYQEKKRDMKKRKKEEQKEKKQKEKKMGNMTEE